MGEFELIRRHFTRDVTAPGVALGIGDDCALLQVAPGHQLAVSTDMLVEGRHFFSDVDPETLGHKALAVNLSDLAAMGARPLAFTLALSLPHADDPWLQGFSTGLLRLSKQFGCPLVGGDTTRGPLNICITVMGEVAPGRSLRRDAAQPGDDLWLSGRTGEARIALERLQGTPWGCDSAVVDGALCRQRLESPTPRVALGLALGGVAHAAIDLSDGLAGDLGHILVASGVGAEIWREALPEAPSVQALPEIHRIECLLNGGDDYELLFTASVDARDAVAAAAASSETPVHRIGRITGDRHLRLRRPGGEVIALATRGFDHFAQVP